jgi:hypothetical protein
MRKWMTYGAAAFLFLGGCSKSANEANTASNQAAPGQDSSQQQANAAMPETPQPLAIPAGTSIPVILASTLNSRVNKPGEEFEANVATPILVNGEEAIPKGASVRGIIVDAKKQGTFKGEANMAVKLTSLRVRGKSYKIATNLYAGTEKGKGKRTAVVTGGGAALGALIGGLAGGGKGAAIGAGVGAGGGLAASGATGGKNVEFPAESRLTFKLSQAVTIDR